MLAPLPAAGASPCRHRFRLRLPVLSAAGGLCAAALLLLPAAARRLCTPPPAYYPPPPSYYPPPPAAPAYYPPPRARRPIRAAGPCAARNTGLQRIPDKDRDRRQTAGNRRNRLPSARRKVAHRPIEFSLEPMLPTVIGLAHYRDWRRWRQQPPIAVGRSLPRHATADFRPAGPGMGGPGLPHPHRRDRLRAARLRLRSDATQDPVLRRPRRAQPVPAPRTLRPGPAAAGVLLFSPGWRIMAAGFRAEDNHGSRHDPERGRRALQRRRRRTAAAVPHPAARPFRR